MKVLYLTRHEWMGASSRYRSVQFFPLLEENGIEIIHRPFFDDAYLAARYKGRFNPFKILGLYLRRLKTLMVDARKADCLVVEKELFPYWPAWLERRFTPAKPIIYDFDDAVWHAYEVLGPSFLKGKFAKLVARAHRIVAGSTYLVNQLRDWTEAPVIKIPTCVSSKGYQGQGLSAQKTADIVWIGSNSTAPFVLNLLKVFGELAQQKPDLKVRLIGCPENLIPEVPPWLELCSWSAETELDLIQTARIGIMPVPDGPFERGKCGFKLIQYMGLGLPSIASPVGENEFILDEESCGFLASDPDEWRDCLTNFLNNEGLQTSMGVAAFERFKSHYQTEVAVLEWIKVFDSSIKDELSTPLIS